VSDDENGSFEMPYVPEEVLDPPHNITKAFPAREWFVDEIDLGHVQLLNGTPGPVTVVAFPQSPVGSPQKLGRFECYLGRGYCPR
jgi:hypothetical protein